MAKKLLTQGETGALSGLGSGQGEEFSVNLKLVNGQVRMYFTGRSASDSRTEQ